MRCPFLHETRARQCGAAPLRKLIASGRTSAIAERCSTPTFVDCSVFQEHGGESLDGASCPFLHESLMHYCGAAPVLRYVPYSEQSGRCSSDSFHFCELYLAFERAGKRASEPRTGDIQVPADLYYSPNHLWLKPGSGGACHVGIDDFLAAVLGSVDAITFLTLSGVNRPGAVLTVQGVDWPVSFRNRILITNAHVYLRSDPSRITSDPYGGGWLFEGFELPDSPAAAGLMSGPQALAWMETERARLDQFVHELAGSAGPAGSAVVNDGGAAVRDLCRQLGREEILRMLNAFFAPDRAWREEASH